MFRPSLLDVTGRYPYRRSHWHGVVGHCTSCDLAQISYRILLDSSSIIYNKDIYIIATLE